MEDNKIKKDDLNKKSPLGVSQPPRAGRAGGPKGTGFTNIQSIIKANQGNKLGQAVAGGVQQQGQQVRAGVQQATQKFGQQVQAGRLGDQDQQKAQGLVTKAAGLGAGQDLSEQEMQEAQKYAQGAYQGPRDVENAAQLAGQAAEAEQLGKLGASSAGRQGLLQRFVGAPQYSFGQQKLDNLLLGASQGDLAKARAATRGVTDQAVSSIQAARGQAEEAALGNRRFADLFKEQAGKAQGDIISERDKALAAAAEKEKGAESAYGQFSKNLLGFYDPNAVAQGYRTGLGSGLDIIENFQGLRPEDKQRLSSVVQQADALGIDPRAAIQGILKPYEQAQGLTAGEFTSGEQAARINALAKLAGKETQDFSQAGKFKAGSGGVDEKRADMSASSLDRIKMQDKRIAEAGAPHQKAATNPGSLTDQEKLQYLTPQQLAAYKKYQLQSQAGDQMQRVIAANQLKAFHDAIQQNAAAQTKTAQDQITQEKQALINSFLSRGY